ncbi:unnamed protein product [Scytosiphon promiscuus]
MILRNCQRPTVSTVIDQDNDKWQLSSTSDVGVNCRGLRFGMFGTARRKVDREKEAVPILQKTAKSRALAPAPPPATETPASPRPSDVRPSHNDATSAAAAMLAEEGSYNEGGSGLRVAEKGDESVEAIEDGAKALPAGASLGDGKPLIPESIVRGIAYGTVNGILLPPVLVSFTAMIFRDPAFASHLPRLVKLVMFSGAVHAACFGCLSSLNFAVGSVQDAGLIFLSAIASTVVAYSREEGIDEAGMLSTSCFILCTCTGLLGVALVVLGRLRLASVVQYLPMPVVGGYLAFIGYFCGQAGLAFASGLEISCISDLGMLANSNALLLVLPSILAGVVMYLCLRRFPSPATLPVLMATFLGTFFAFLWARGATIEDARAAGWVSPASPMLPLNRAWDYFSFGDVRWGAFSRVAPNLFAMIVVVAFSSCLDVAAIEMEMGTPLDFNGELQTVGWSNIVSGLFGGFTGSYIFSQTIFNLRAGVDTRAASATSTVMLFAVAASPLSVISFLPRCFFGSLLVLISVDLMVEWLWQARLRMMPAEYLVCLATFASIQAWGVEKGMLAGLVLAALNFTITYAQVPSVMTARIQASTVMRTFEERVILKAHQEQTVVLELQARHRFTLCPASNTTCRFPSHNFESVPDACGRVEGCKGTRASRLIALLHSPLLTADSEPLLALVSARPVGARTTLASRPSSLCSPSGPVFNRSGAIYPSSPSTTAAAIARSQSWWDSSSETFPSWGAISPLARSLPGGRRRSAEAVPSVFGAKGGRPFHRSTSERVVEGQEDHQGEGAALLASGGGSAHRNAGGSVSNGERQTTYGATQGGQPNGQQGERGTTNRIMRKARAARFRFNSHVPLLSPSCTRDAWSCTKLWANGGASTDSLGDHGFGASSPGSTGNVGGGLIGSSPRFSGRVARSASVVSLLPASEQRTRRVILDFSNVASVDATAARSCFLMLKLVLSTSGAEVVFSGATRKIQALLRSHGVITDDDPVFNRREDARHCPLDDALEWSEEMMLKERRDDMLLRRITGGAGTVGGTSPSLFASPYRKDQHAGDERRSSFRGRADGQEAGDASEGMTRGQWEQAEEETDEERPRATTSAEAAAFAGGHENYYFRAETLRRRSSMAGQISNQVAEDEAVIVGDVGSLQSILEDYLEVDRYQVPESVRRVLGEAQSYFREEHVSAGAVLATDNRSGAPSSSSSPEKLYFIGAGSVELQIHGEFGPRRLQKVCAGGTFGEVGFFLRSPQAFRAVAREPCHLHTLDREGMAAMQRQNPGLCILVQKALMKSICLAASLSIEKHHLGPVDDGRPERLGKIEEEH